MATAAPRRETVVRPSGATGDSLVPVGGLPRKESAPLHRLRSRHALRRAPRALRARRQSDPGDSRCTERQRRRKRGRSLDPSGYDAGKKVLGRKRHVFVDAQGLLLNVDVHAADIQDRDGAETLLRRAWAALSIRRAHRRRWCYAEPKMSALVARTGR